jgi:phosphomannomutase
MGAGYSCMSDLTIIQSTQGLLRYAQTVLPDLKKRGVVVGYDARHNSHR